MAAAEPSEEQTNYQEQKQPQPSLEQKEIFQLQHKALW